MEPILYSRWKLATMAGLCAFAAAVVLAEFVDPAIRLPGIAGLVARGWFGHFVAAPIVILGCALLAWRIGMVAAGSLEAVTPDAQGVRVTTLWKSVDIPWRDLILARVIVRKSRYGTRYYLCFDRRSASSVRVSVGLTTLRVADYADYVAALGQHQYLEVRKPAQKAAVAVAAVEVPRAQAPRGFGRKGVIG